MIELTFLCIISINNNVPLNYDSRRSRSTSRHRRERAEDRIDKKRLLEIARKNAISMLKNGTLPGTRNLDPEAKERALTKMRYGGKSIETLGTLMRNKVFMLSFFRKIG